MFYNLRTGQQLHILHKTVTPYIEIGTVESINNMTNMGYFPGMPSLPMDISVRIGERTTTYQQLPSNADCAEVTERNSGEKVFISDNKDALNAEIQSMRQKSIDTLNSVDYHRNRIETCNKLLNQLNPEQAEKAAQQAEINNLKEQMGSMTKSMEQLLEQNRQLMEQIKSGGNNSSSTKNK